MRSEYDLRADQNASRRPSREMAVLIPKAALPEKGSFFPEAKLLVAADGFFPKAELLVAADGFFPEAVLLAPEVLWAATVWRAALAAGTLELPLQEVLSSREACN